MAAAASMPTISFDSTPMRLASTAVLQCSQPSQVMVRCYSLQPVVSVYGYSSVTVRSNWLRGYNVYVDGSLAAAEGRAGNQAGSVTFSVQGDQYNIAIDGASLTYSD